jgi:hypothetical protein
MCLEIAYHVVGRGVVADANAAAQTARRGCGTRRRGQTGRQRRPRAIVVRHVERTFQTDREESWGVSILQSAQS